MENVRQIYQAYLLLQLDTDMQGYDQPEQLLHTAEKVGCCPDLDAQAPL